jgi:hypothetical protein
MQSRYDNFMASILNQRDRYSKDTQHVCILIHYVNGSSMLVLQGLRTTPVRMVGTLSILVPSTGHIGNEER